MIRNRYSVIGVHGTGTHEGPNVFSNANTAFQSRGRVCVQIVAAMLGVAMLLHAEDAKKIPTEEAMSALVSKVAPEYPPLAKQMKLTGQVELQTDIDEDGSVGEVTTVSGNPILARAAGDAVKKWKFKPFKSRVSTTIVVGFHGVNN